MDWSARMAWRNLTYIEKLGHLSFRIEPMAEGPDLVFLPDAPGWISRAPAWASQRAVEIVARLQSLRWSRELYWRRGEQTPFLHSVDPSADSIEASRRGRNLEQLEIFSPGSYLTHAQSRALWHSVCKDFAAAAIGLVIVRENKVIRHSAFDAVSLPVLRANSKINLRFV